MRLIGTALSLLTIFASSGCERIGAVTAAPPDFELRECVIKEERKEPTEYSKGYNTFTGSGTLLAKNVESNRNLLVWLEARDTTEGASAEPKITAVLLRGGVGKVELVKSDYDTFVPRPNYEWSVLGWQELHRATIRVPAGP